MLIIDVSIAPTDCNCLKPFFKSQTSLRQYADNEEQLERNCAICGNCQRERERDGFLIT